MVACARALNTRTHAGLAGCADNKNILICNKLLAIITNKQQNEYKVACFVPLCEDTQPVCKIKLSKFTKIAFFLIAIMIIAKKCIIFASNFTNEVKTIHNY